MIIIADIILITIRKKKKIIINGKEKETHRVKMGSWSFKLLPKNIKTFGKKNNNNNNIKLKEMELQHLSQTTLPRMDTWEMLILYLVCYE